MSKEQNIKRFTAADIVRYHKGLMAAKERHALEKAALDDPFLADALEGYGQVAANVTDDIAELRKRIGSRTKKTETAPVVPGRPSFAWWKVAAMIVIVIGAGLLVYQIAFNKKSMDLAQARKDSPVTTGAKDSNIASQPSATVTEDNAQGDSSMVNTNRNDKKTSQADKSIPSKEIKSEVTGKKEDANADGIDDDIDKENQKSPVTESLETSAKNKDANEINPIPNRELTKAKNPRSDNAAPVSTDVQSKEAESKPNAAAIATQRNQGFVNRSNVFRGRVTDNNNNALPFSNITNLDDNIGTYSDARGYFVLTSPDSVLNVQIRSLGFETTNAQLNHINQENKIQLEGDKSLSANVLDTVKRNTNRSLNPTMTLDEPEPADGWNNYDTYLANNLKMPESFKSRQNSGIVELEFEVDRNGIPYNIVVKKSLCESCDKEAVRLVKEGPKWKRKFKKGRANVTVSF